MIDNSIEQMLLGLQDADYKIFQCRLMPTVSPDTVIGVRTPQLRKLANQIYKSDKAETFLKALPHRYYEENNLHAFLIEKIKDYNSCIEAVEEFLPYVDNWATCDSMSPPVFKNHLPRLLKQIDIWLESNHTYTVRFAIGMLMKLYLDDNFKPEYLRKVAEISSGEYYINMMKAWYFATALAKQYETALPYITGCKLDIWVHNKTIQKAIESYRITAEQKMFLKTLKI